MREVETAITGIEACITLLELPPSYELPEAERLTWESYMCQRMDTLRRHDDARFNQYVDWFNDYKGWTPRRTT